MPVRQPFDEQRRILPRLRQRRRDPPRHSPCARCQRQAILGCHESPWHAEIVYRQPVLDPLIMRSNRKVRLTFHDDDFGSRLFRGQRRTQTCSTRSNDEKWHFCAEILVTCHNYRTHRLKYYSLLLAMALALAAVSFL